MASTISCPSIPCVEYLPSPLNSGSLIRIFGTVASSATCFAINLQNGSSTDPRSDIALHLSPVFSPPPRLVRNSLENQNWGPEESHGTCFPFACDENFEILILAEADHFKIAVNGQHFTEFHYRLPLNRISHIAIDGDVTIKEIKFESLAKSPIETDSGDEKPLGFVIEKETKASLAPPQLSGRPPSPYDSSSLPYPTNPSFGPSPMYNIPSPTENPYGPPPQGSPYGPPQGNPYGPSQGNPYGPPQGNPYGPPQGNPYGPPMQNPYGPPPESNMYPSGRVSPSPYGPPPETMGPYGPQTGGYPYSPQHGYPQQPGGYPQGYPQHPGSYPQGYPQQQSGSYPGYPYPSQQGQYPGTSVVYPGQEKKSDGGGYLGPLAAAGAAALAGVAGSHIMGGKKHKKNKHGHYGVPGMGGAGPASLISGVGSLLTGSGKKHGSHGGSSMGGPMGGALAGGAAALAGAYMLNKSPMGKMMKPKKMKFKGWGSSSSSSSSDEE